MNLNLTPEVVNEYYLYGKLDYVKQQILAKYKTMPDGKDLQPNSKGMFEFRLVVRMQTASGKEFDSIRVIQVVRENNKLFVGFRPEEEK